jgi:hypothetical protein
MAMTKREKQRITAQENTLMGLGFTAFEAEKLRKISMTLQRWHELECGIDGGCIERDEKTDKPFWRSEYSGKLSPIADREKGAKKRLNHFIGMRNTREWAFQGCPMSQVEIKPYIQGDPRGAALYLIRPDDIPEGKNVDSYYSRGICVY